MNIVPWRFLTWSELFFYWFVLWLSSCRFGHWHFIWKPQSFVYYGKGAHEKSCVGMFEITTRTEAEVDHFMPVELYHFETNHEQLSYRVMDTNTLLKVTTIPRSHWVLTENLLSLHTILITDQLLYNVVVGKSWPENVVRYYYFGFYQQGQPWFRLVNHILHNSICPILSFALSGSCSLYVPRDSLLQQISTIWFHFWSTNSTRFSVSQQSPTTS